MTLSHTLEVPSNDDLYDHEKKHGKALARVQESANLRCHQFMLSVRRDRTPDDMTNWTTVSSKDDRVIICSMA